MINGQGINCETRFQRGVLVQVVDDNLGDRITFEFDDDAVVFIGFIPHRGDVGDDFFVYQVGNALDQHGAIDVVRDLRNDNLLPATFQLFQTYFAPDLETAAASGKVVADALQ